MKTLSTIDVTADSQSRLAPAGGFSLETPGLRVTQICTTAVRGGAAKAAHRLHHALAGMGVRSQMMVAQRFSADEDSLEYNPARPAPAMLGRVLFRLGRRWHRPSFQKAGAYFTPEWTLTGWRLAAQLPPCDLVNLHWVADLLDYRTLPQIAARVPVVWTFHDMNAFTGGCHYSGPCERYTDRCGTCPQLKTSSGENDMTRRVMDRKRRIFERIPPARLTIVCPSGWLAREAGRSALCRGFDVRVIPNGIDPRQYHPVGRDEARRQLNLPADAKIILFVADFIEDQRKGLRLLLQAFDAIRHIPRLLLVTLGRGDTSLLSGPFFRHLGTFHDPEKLRAAYSAADVFAIPSLQDNLPNTIIESMACGTPVVGFDVGGIGEAVVNGQTGLLASAGDASAFAAGLRRLLEDPRLQSAMAIEGRARVEREYTVRLQAARYASLYGEIVRSRPAGHPPASPNLVTT
ncbi:MAG TPA: glycosyltransferase family 4 protein [Opitutaceae bacterium]|nr:glycosyltransferase family 4 protein [Opitutaceae bacterium]